MSFQFAIEGDLSNPYSFRTNVGGLVMETSFWLRLL